MKFITSRFTRLVSLAGELYSRRYTSKRSSGLNQWCLIVASTTKVEEKQLVVCQEASINQ